MKVPSSKKFIYREWTIDKDDSDVLFVRKCSSESFELFDAKIIKADNGKFQCEVPIKMYPKKLKKDVNIYIKNLKKFDSLEQSVLWVDITLSKSANTEVKQPFVFLWY